jgi:hypothetical protein
MSVYVDTARHGLGRMVMGHMVADTLDELHAMASALGLKPEWFQKDSSFPHYDVSLSVRRVAVARGAIEVSPRQLASIIRRLRPVTCRDLGGVCPACVDGVCSRKSA